MVIQVHLSKEEEEGAPVVLVLMAARPEELEDQESKSLLQDLLLLPE